MGGGGTIQLDFMDGHSSLYIYIWIAGFQANTDQKTALQFKENFNKSRLHFKTTNSLTVRKYTM